MRIHTLNLGPLGTNCYIAETAPGRCVAFDIGGDSGVFLDYLRKNALRLTKILLTHGHFDHIGGVEKVRRATGAEVYIHEFDTPMLSSEDASLHSRMCFTPFVPVELYTVVRGDCYINDAECSFRVLHTPGHTRGGVCYICEDVIFSGDTLFCESIGRTDFPGSNPYSMKNSLLKLAELEGEYRIYPGHNERTTMSHEKRYNPYIRELII